MSIATQLLLLAQEHAPEAAEGGATRVVLPEIDELIFGAIAFFLLLFILSKVAFPALRKGLAEREQAIRSELERAEQARLETEAKREEYERQIADARGEADRIMREATEAAEGVRRERVAKAEEEARSIIEKARADASQERERAFAELQRTVADLTLEASRRVLEQELANPEAQRQLVERFIATAGASAGAGTNN
jgi:F-type H+-transporting ATPase subunit b